MPEAKIIQISTNQAANSDVIGHMSRLLMQLGLSSDTDFVEPGDAAALRRSLVHGLQSCNVVVTIGSFGQYGVSGAKETVFKALDIPFMEDSVIKERILRFVKAGKLTMTEELESLWAIPRNAEPFPSANGVDSGFGIAAGGQCILMLPSAPDSFHPMAAGDALSYLARFFGLCAIRHRVNCFGLAHRSIVDELYGDILNDNLPLAYPAACHNGLETSLWVTACAATREQAEEICHPAVFRLQQELKDLVYGVDAESMESSVLELLHQRGRTLCMTESYSSGALAQAVERGMELLEGLKSPVQFYGSYMLPDETEEIGLPRRKLRGKDIVTPTGAGMMAEYCRRKGKDNSLGLSLCLDEAVRQVYAALSDGERVYLLIRKLPDDCYGNRAGEYGCLWALKLVQQYFLDPRSLPAGVPVRSAAAGQGFPEAEDPNWEEKMGLPPERNLGRRIVMLLCATVFAASATFLAHQEYLAWNSDQQKTRLETIYLENSSSPSSSSPSASEKINYPAEYLNKFSSLYSINPDIKGWLSIDGTTFSYPVVQSEQDTAESQYYLHRDYNGEYNNHGVPFLDYRADLKKPSDNLVIYGHNMRDGTMFEELLNYKDPDYYRAHPLIRFDSVYEEAEYRVVSVFITNTLKSHGELFEYHNFINSPSDDSFDQFLYGIQIRSILNTGVDVRAGDKLLTLSTCSYEFKGARFVVVARKLRDEETREQAMDVSAVSKNENVLYPDIWYSLYKQEKPNISLMRIVLPKTAQPLDMDLTLSLNRETAPPSELEDITPIPSRKPVNIAQAPSQPEGSEDSQPENGDASSGQAESENTPPELSSVPDASGSMASSSSSEPPESITPSQPSEASQSQSSLEPEPSSQPEPSSSSQAQASLPPVSSSRPAVIKVPSSSSKPIVIRPSSSVPEEDPMIEEEDMPDGTDGDYREDDPAASDSDSSNDGESGGSYNGDETLSVYINGSRHTGSAYDIVCQVVAAEMGAGHKEALKAQAVAAYTYISYENARGVSPSVAAKTATAAVKTAVQEVIGEAIYYKGNLAFACYHATSAGRTNSSKDVWGGSYPYLVSVDSSIDEDAYRYEDTKRISTDVVAAAVEKQLGITLEGDPADWFEVLSYTDGGYNDRMAVGGETQYYYDANRKYYPITGRVLREAVLGLRSACFTVEYLDNRDEFLFTTYGYGHGVGMSQTGAILMANQGDSYVDILEHYFPGTTVR